MIELLNQYGDKEKELIIRIGKYIYDYHIIINDHHSYLLNHSSLGNEQIEVLKQTINELKEQIHEERLDKYNQLNDLKSNKEERIKEEEMKIKAMYEKEKELIKQNHNLFIESIRENNKLTLESMEKDKSILEEKVSLLQKSEKEVRETLENVYGQKKFTSSNEKGDYAENWVQTVIDSGLPFDTKTTFKDTSQLAGSGDGIITIPSYNLRLMIEVKNKTAIDEQDLSQFHKHSDEDLKHKHVDASLLLSFRCKNIRGQGNCNIVKYEPSNKQKMYYSFPENITLDEKKQRFINTLEEICERFQSEKTQETNKEKEKTNINNISFIEKQLKHYKNEEERIKKEEKRLHTSSEEIKQRKEECKQNVNQILRYLEENLLLNEINPVYIEWKKDEIKEQLILKLKQHIIDKQLLLPKSNWKQVIKQSLENPLCEYEKKIFNNLKKNQLC